MIVATYNVRHCRGRDGVVDVERTAAVIAATGAEVVALQELDRGLRRSGDADQPAELARLTGLDVAFAATVVGDGGEYGIALAAASPVEIAVEPLPRLGREEPRAAVVARHAGVTFVATHLSTRPSPRRVQMERLATIASASAGPVIVLGDLNAGPRALGPLRAAGLAPCPGRHATWGGVRYIDHILGSAEVAFERAWTVASDASDHVPLAAEAAVTGRG